MLIVICALYRRPGQANETVSVRVRSRDGTAFGGKQAGVGVDFVHIDQVLEFGPGEIAKSVDVTVRGYSCCSCSIAAYC